ncbi:TPA: hypothetical protein JBA21_05975 [Legionella pneumophila]|uniref:Uncharacterized protein n=2 Tax=Legionella TaxID=445 RepID=A0ABX2XTL8_9GAMM|nr:MULTISPECIES: hypothetical protein [Legionella]OCH97896.1 hypothetical protein A8135_01350 [Legionella jamestowniensis]TIG73518.1 hypothetical protein DI129_01005 [Legionella pneumophila]TIG85474.1 hypothetical protein DI110_08245 [Legionella pneumophila]TIG93300.1 hypothetical protein DI130_06950 [Legionella pneumophila]TIG94719.1 hypothetical protein DI125_06950 [Legionella pneumophila]
MEIATINQIVSKGMAMNAKDSFVEKEHEEKTREATPLLDEKKRHEIMELENKIDLDDEFYAIRSVN